MSYDLYFRTRDGKTKPDARELAAHFEARPNYTLHEGAAEYANDDTGVYFSFDWSPPDPEYREEGDIDHEVSFNINYNRPSFFGLEAAPELKAFTERFAYVVDDPQMDGMGEAAGFTEEGFIKGWNAGNLFGVRAVARHDGAAPGPSTLPRAALHAIWRWNYTRKELQAKVGDDLFVPRIMPLFQAGTILSVAVWGDLVPSVLPEVDLLLAPLATFKGWFEKEGTIHLLPFDGLTPLLSACKTDAEPLRHWFLDYEQPPRDLLKHVRKSRKSRGQMSLVSWDSLLDLELIDAARKKT